MLAGLDPILIDSFLNFPQPNFLLHKITNRQKSWANAFEHLLYLGAKTGVVSERHFYTPGGMSGIIIK